jgi:hypothetical protein
LQAKPVQCQGVAGNAGDRLDQLTLLGGRQPGKAAITQLLGVTLRQLVQQFCGGVHGWLLKCVASPQRR